MVQSGAMKSLKAFFAWVRSHKIKAAYFLVQFILCAWLIAEKVPSKGLWPVALSFVLFVFFVLVLEGDIHKPLLIGLLIAFFTYPAKAEEKNLGVAVGCAVVVGGGIVAVLLYKFCKKAYAKQTNSSPEEFRLAGGDESAASDTYFAEYCQEPMPDLVQPLSTNIVVEGEVTGQTITITVLNGPRVQSAVEFRAEMATHGLPLGFGRQYAVNGVAAYQWDTPITFDMERGIVPHVTIAGDNQITTVIERSYDMVEWIPLVTNTVPSNLKLRFDDQSSMMAAFYRVTLP